MNIDIWYKETIRLNIDDNNEHILPNAPLIKASIISAAGRSGGWYNVLTEEGKFDKVDERQIFFTQQKGGEKVANPIQKWPVVPTDMSPRQLWWLCFGGLLSFLVVGQLIMLCMVWFLKMPWDIYGILQIMPGVIIYPVLALWTGVKIESYTTLKKFQVQK